MPMRSDGDGGRRQRQINDVEYISSSDAMSLLGVRRETLYTYVSRGLIKMRISAIVTGHFGPS